MRLLLEEDLAWCTTLDEVQQQTQETLAELRDDGYAIHYVGGPVSCDGEAKIPENLAKLIEARTTVMHDLGHSCMVFTAPFIFSMDPDHNSYNRLGLFEIDRDLREQALQKFWDELIASKLIDGAHFIDGWQRSPGATREHEAAIEHDVAVYESWLQNTIDSAYRSIWIVLNTTHV